MQGAGRVLQEATEVVGESTQERDGDRQGREKPETRGYAAREINSPHGSDEETPDLEVEEAKPGAHGALRYTGVQGEKLDRLLKEEALGITPETNESQERWRVNLDETDTSVCRGPAIMTRDLKMPCDLGSGFDKGQKQAIMDTLVTNLITFPEQIWYGSLSALTRPAMAMPA
ncbi:hypothetical protein INR49_025757 [Caranx melampygus]|nr:hypothetical protein INR49_025757 [Caranx melampygus]